MKGQIRVQKQRPRFRNAENVSEHVKEKETLQRGE